MPSSYGPPAAINLVIPSILVLSIRNILHHLILIVVDLLLHHTELEDGLLQLLGDKRDVFSEFPRTAQLLLVMPNF
jgi:hypothetical protein